MQSDRAADKASPSRKPVQKPPTRAAPAKTPTSSPPSATGAVQRAVEDPAGLSPADVLALQRVAGNRAVNRMLAASALPPPPPPPPPGGLPIQAKLTVGPAGDQYEQEADRVASQVMRVSEPATPPIAPQDDDLGLQAKPLGSGISRVQRQEEEEEEEDELQAKPLAGGLRPLAQRRAGDPGAGFTHDAKLEDRLRSTAGSGNQLPGATRTFMENRFGADFGGVRVHRGGESAQLNRQINAQAFTHGSDIYFGAGKYNPGTSAGNHLLAHELTHVVQQTGGAQLKRKPVHRSTLKSEPVVQRYPANVFDEGAAVNWQEETEEVTRPGEGLSGGIYFFKGKAGPVTKAVIKPEYNQNVGKVDVADKFLKAMRVEVPDSRVLPPDSPEAGSIRTTAADKGQAIPAEFDFGGYVEPLAYLRVMETVPGKSVASAAKGAGGSMSDVNDLIRVLEDEALIKQIGRLVALDAFIGMGDRIRTFGANLGNLMFRKDAYGAIITAIDNESKKFAPQAMKLFTKEGTDISTPLKDISDLYDSRDEYFRWFKDGLQVGINNQQLLLDYGIDMTKPLHGLSPEEFQLTAETTSHAKHFGEYYKFDQWKAWFDAGIQQGIADLMDMLKLRGFKKTKKGLKKTFKAAGESWDTFRVREKFLTLRSQGMSRTDAQAAAKKYAKYRKARRGTRAGLKWTQKLKYLATR